jgi:serine/threonine protein kinase
MLSQISSIDPVGSVIRSRYSVESLLGQGGFGAVYKGKDITLDVPVALKMLFDSSQDSVNQFHLEAKILAQLHHPGLPRVTDFFSMNSNHFLVMDYIDGQDLESLTNSRPLSIDLILDWIIQVLDTLEYVHINDVIHRDIKPGNIRINTFNKAMLVDFGIAKTGSRLMTAPGARGSFTPYFAPPEQCQISGLTTPSSDIYSVGATLYYLLTRTLPPDGVSRLMGSKLVLPKNFNNNIKNELCDIIVKSIAIEPRDRYQNANSMKNELISVRDKGICNSIIPQAQSNQNKSNSTTFRREIRRR